MLWSGTCKWWHWNERWRMTDGQGEETLMTIAATPDDGTSQRKRRSRIHKQREDNTRESYQYPSSSKCVLTAKGPFVFAAAACPNLDVALLRPYLT